MPIPNCITDAQICTNCYTSQAGSCGNGNMYRPCETYCNTGCNTSCYASQAFCSLTYQLISSHPDVGAFPAAACLNQGEIISKNWTAAFWNSLITKITTAETRGIVQSQGAGPAKTNAVQDTNLGTATNHPANSLITADKYNQIRNSLVRFNVTYPTVNAQDVIKAAQAQAIRTAYNDALFNTNVCDVCNVGNQHRGVGCGCQCQCGPCTCACFCPCSCPCYCNCDCNCYNN